MPFPGFGGLLLGAAKGGAAGAVGILGTAAQAKKDLDRLQGRLRNSITPDVLQAPQGQPPAEGANTELPRENFEFGGIQSLLLGFPAHLKRQDARQKQFDSVMNRAKKLLRSGDITQEQFLNIQLDASGLRATTRDNTDRGNVVTRNLPGGKAQRGREFLDNSFEAIGEPFNRFKPARPRGELTNSNTRANRTIDADRRWVEEQIARGTSTRRLQGDPRFENANRSKFGEDPQAFQQWRDSIEGRGPVAPRPPGAPIFGPSGLFPGVR